MTIGIILTPLRIKEINYPRKVHHMAVEAAGVISTVAIKGKWSFLQHHWRNVPQQFFLDPLLTCSLDRQFRAIRNLHMGNLTGLLVVEELDITEINRMGDIPICRRIMKHPHHIEVPIMGTVGISIVEPTAVGVQAPVSRTVSII
jgi:hypothetical protein